MKLLVTGGTGFLGAHLVPKLVAAGHTVRLIGRSRPTGPAYEGTEYVAGDLKDRDAVRRALDGVEGLYHLAGLVSFQPKDARKMFELHVDSTRELLRDVREAGVKRVVLASTSGTTAVSKEEAVLDESADYPLTVVARWPYYLSKIYEEKLSLEYCRKHAIPLVVLNPSLLMGPGDDRLSSTWTVVKFLNREIPAMPGGGMSFVDVRDAADAFLQALTRGEVYGRHLMGVNMTMTEFFHRLERLTGVAAPRLKLPKQVNILGGHLLERWAKVRGTPAPLDPQEVEIGEHYFWLDAAKAEAELGFRARDAQETLADTVKHIYAKLPPGSLPGTKGRLGELRDGT
ncbi:NAD-dependent epimerase/dehydratase family protein [Myxococcus faecalis]|uniref:NAD-dependent epimerase/dehydratase family protein n=1 Tax=Myxococcus TaxID=32 RepID=UPI001CBD93DF|nr:NAD-dependent epimerase/dehydratase family protein [Myxococcus sp. AS-1-15]MBZ4409728.1 NAD-dependent epimerase/dehydratase family protein [Myxococcus sp. XM-1-1-1]BDT32141.1 NAD-dependent epimerase/dehydratase family protein [Myxococcus sp. MH1]